MDFEPELNTTLKKDNVENFLEEEDYFDPEMITTLKKDNVEIFWEEEDYFFQKCNPNLAKANVRGLNFHHFNMIRKISMRDIPNLAISYLDFKFFSSDILPETIALKISLLPLVSTKKYDVVENLNGYYQAQLTIDATFEDIVVYPDMIDFDTFGTPLEIANVAKDTPLFIASRGDSIHLHFYIAKGTANQNQRWTSVVTFMFINNTNNTYSKDYSLTIETNGSLDPKFVFNKSLELYN